MFSKYKKKIVQLRYLQLDDSYQINKYSYKT